MLFMAEALSPTRQKRFTVWDAIRWMAPRVRRLLALKGRPAGRGLILIAADFDQLRPYVGQLEKPLMKQVLESWPGPNTGSCRLPKSARWLAYRFA